MHATFLVALVGSLLLKQHGGELLTKDGEISAAIVRVAQSHGLHYRGLLGSPDADIRPMAFEVPGCDAPLLITSLAVTFEALALQRELPGAGRYVYLDRSWASPAPLAVFVERMKNTALAVIGYSPYVPSWHMLHIIDPPGCDGLQAIDWRAVWDRKFFNPN